MTSKKKSRRGPGRQATRGSGSANRKARTILIVVVIGVLLLIIFFFVGNYLYGPKRLGL